MRDDGAVTGLLRHLDRLEGFGQGADLIEFDQNGVANPLIDPPLQNGGVGHEQIVTDQLDAIADRLGQQAPASPVVLVHAVFDGDDRKTVDETDEVVDKAGRIEASSLGCQHVLPVLKELAGGDIQSQGDLVTGPVAGLDDGRHQQFKRFFVRPQVRGEPPLVADRRAQTPLPQDRLERMKDLGAGAQRRRKVRQADRHDHEFLDIDPIVRMCATVEDIHHRDRQAGRMPAVGQQRGAQGLAARRRHRLRIGKRYAEQGVGAETGLVVGAVEIDQGTINGTLVCGILPTQGPGNFPIDVGNRLADTLAVPAQGIAIAQLDRFAFPGRGTRRHRRPTDRTILEMHLGLEGGISPGVEDFDGGDFLYSHDYVRVGFYGLRFTVYGFRVRPEP